MFQSLFSWMFFSKTLTETEWKLLIKFQSLFSWMFFSKIWHPSNCPIYHQFQSLFSWMFFSKKEQVQRVLIKHGSFNPCSLGCFSRSGIHRKRPGSILWFQSLFSWMFFSKVSLICDLLNSIIQFQSLFSWMFFSKQMIQIRKIVLPRVSILVLLDVFLEACFLKALIRYNSPFQSLFSWMFFSKF